MRRVVVELREASFLDNFASLHYEKAIRKARLNFRRMIDKEDRQPNLLLQASQQSKQLSLVAAIQRRGGFVCDQKSGTASQSLREDNTLKLSAAQLVRIGREKTFGRMKVYSRKPGLRVGAALLPAASVVGVQDLGDLVAHAQDRAQRDSRLLRHKRNLCAPDLFQRPLVQREQFLSAKLDRAGHVHRLHWVQANERKGKTRLATSRLSDKSDYLTRANLEADFGDGRLCQPALREVANSQMSCLEKRLHLANHPVITVAIAPARVDGTSVIECAVGSRTKVPGDAGKRLRKRKSKRETRNCNFAFQRRLETSSSLCFQSLAAISNRYPLSIKKWSVRRRKPKQILRLPLVAQDDDLVGSSKRKVWRSARVAEVCFQ